MEELPLLRASGMMLSAAEGAQAGVYGLAKVAGVWWLTENGIPSSTSTKGALPLLRTRQIAHMTCRRPAQKPPMTPLLLALPLPRCVADGTAVPISLAYDTSKVRLRQQLAPCVLSVYGAYGRPDDLEWSPWR